MRDSLSLIGLELTREDTIHTIIEMYFTSLNQLYIGVKCHKSGCTTNYPIQDFKGFLKKNGFSVKESIASEFLLN